MNHSLAVLFVILGNLIWGASFMFTKIGMRYCSPVLLLSLRFTVAALTMILLTSLCRKSSLFKVDFKGRNLKPLLILSFFQPITYFYFEAYGLKYTSAVLSSVMVATVPVIALFFEAFKYKTKIPKDKLFFSFICFLGVSVVSLGSKNTGETSLLGVSSLFIAILIAIAFNYYSRKASVSFTAYERSFFMFISGAVVYDTCILFKYGFNLKEILKPLKYAEFNISILYLGVLSTVAAFTFINIGLTVLSVSETTIYNTLATIMGVLCGIFILNETAGFVKIAGCIIIISGLLGFNRTHRSNGPDSQLKGD